MLKQRVIESSLGRSHTNPLCIVLIFRMHPQREQSLEKKMYFVQVIFSLLSILGRRRLGVLAAASCSAKLAVPPQQAAVQNWLFSYRIHCP
jgi:hypothetical protein